MIAKKDPLHFFLFKVSGFCSHNKTQCSLNGHCIMVNQISTADTSSKCQCPTSSDWQPNWHHDLRTPFTSMKPWLSRFRVIDAICLEACLSSVMDIVYHCSGSFQGLFFALQRYFAASCDKCLYYIKIYTRIYI